MAGDLQTTLRMRQDPADAHHPPQSMWGLLRVLPLTPWDLRATQADKLLHTAITTRTTFYAFFTFWDSSWEWTGSLRREDQLHYLEQPVAAFP